MFKRSQNWLRRWLGPSPTPPDATELPNPEPQNSFPLRPIPGGVAVDLDRLGPEARGQACLDSIKKNGVPLFEGEVEHVYTKAFTRTTSRCPRCQAPARPHCGHFIYATGVGLRVILAPAGYFCSACPTVIVDEGMIEAGMKSGVNFRGVVGIDYENRKPPDYFQTFNGSKAVYILDENGRMIGLESLGGNDRRNAGYGLSLLDIPPAPAGRSRQKKRRHQMAKASRKRNRPR